MTPAEAEGSTVVAEVKTTGLGLLKFVRLKILNSSARNCRLTRSVNRNFLATEMSVVASPGPCRKFRGALP